MTEAQEAVYAYAFKRAVTELDTLVDLTWLSVDLSEPSLYNSIWRARQELLKARPGQKTETKAQVREPRASGASSEKFQENDGNCPRCGRFLSGFESPCWGQECEPAVDEIMEMAIMRGKFVPSPEQLKVARAAEKVSIGEVVKGKFVPATLTHPGTVEETCKWCAQPIQPGTVHFPTGACEDCEIQRLM